MIHKIFRDFLFIEALQENSNMVNSPWLEHKWFGGMEGLPDPCPIEILKTVTKSTVKNDS